MHDFRGQNGDPKGVRWKKAIFEKNKEHTLFFQYFTALGGFGFSMKTVSKSKHKSGSILDPLKIRFLMNLC